MKRSIGFLSAVFALVLFALPVSAQMNTDADGMEMRGFTDPKSGAILAAGYIELDSADMADMMVSLMAEDIITDGMTGVKEVRNRELPRECIAFTGRLDGDKAFVAMCSYKTGVYMFLTDMDTDDAIDYINDTLDEGEISKPAGFIEVDMD